eukprot:576453-Amphidinium_carterae.1
MLCYVTHRSAASAWKTWQILYAHKLPWVPTLPLTVASVSAASVLNYIVFSTVVAPLCTHAMPYV